MAFLKLTGVVAGGWMMARRQWPQALLADGDSDTVFLNAKLATALLRRPGAAGSRAVRRANHPGRRLGAGAGRGGFLMSARLARVGGAQ